MLPPGGARPERRASMSLLHAMPSSGEGGLGRPPVEARLPLGCCVGRSRLAENVVAADGGAGRGVVAGSADPGPRPPPHPPARATRVIVSPTRGRVRSRSRSRPERWAGMTLLSGEAALHTHGQGGVRWVGVAPRQGDAVRGRELEGGGRRAGRAGCGGEAHQGGGGAREARSRGAGPGPRICNNNTSRSGTIAFRGQGTAPLLLTTRAAFGLKIVGTTDQSGRAPPSIGWLAPGDRGSEGCA